MASHPAWGTWVGDQDFVTVVAEGMYSVPWYLLIAEYVPDTVLPWDTKKKKKRSLSFEIPTISGCASGTVPESSFSRSPPTFAWWWDWCSVAAPSSIWPSPPPARPLRGCRAWRGTPRPERPGTRAGTGRGSVRTAPVACYPASAYTEGAAEGAWGIQRIHTPHLLPLAPAPIPLLPPLPHVHPQSALDPVTPREAERGEHHPADLGPDLLWPGPAAPPENSEQLWSSSRAEDPAVRGAELGEAPAAV